MSESIKALAQAITSKQPAVLATVIEIEGASPVKAGAQITLLPEGKVAGNVGGGRLEAKIIKAANQALELMKPALHHFVLTEEGQDAIGTLCGGEVTVFVQPYFPPPQLVIVGGGHIGRPLKVMGEAAGFEVVVVDVEPDLATASGLETVNLGDHSYVVLITTDHISDEAAMRVALRSSAPYIGMIGSLAKCRTIIEHLQADGAAPEGLERIYAPVGLDLGGPSPQEIAVGILAEVIAVRRKHALPGGVVKTRRLPPVAAE